MDKGNPCTLLVGLKIGAVIWEIALRFLKKLRTELPDDPAIPLLGIYPDKSMIQNDTCITIFRAELFTTVKIWKTTYMSINR